MPVVQQSDVELDYDVNGSTGTSPVTPLTLTDGKPAEKIQQRMPRADIILVFPYKTDATVCWGAAHLDEAARGLQRPCDKDRQRMEAWEEKRQECVRALDDCGLILMMYFSRDRDEIFMKMFADEPHLKKVAEATRHQLELRPEYLSAFAEYQNDYAGKWELNYQDRRTVSHVWKPHSVGKTERKKSIFRTTDRIQLVDHIIRSQDHRCAGLDVGELMQDGDVLHYFPMHEYGKLSELDRDWLRAFVSGSRIDNVRDYFGEKIALYFLFMSHFNKWLCPPAAFGMLLCCLDVIFGMPDTFTALPMALFMGFWTMLFIHFWRRKASSYALKWGTFSVNRKLERTRPEFVGISRVNPVTGRIDRIYPWSERIWKVVFSYAVLSLTIIVLLFIIMTIYAMRHVMGRRGRLFFQVFNAIRVEIFNSLFTGIATWLTARENHRKNTEYEYNLFAKTVIFKFVNCYSSLYYIAFFKAHTNLFGMPMTCIHDDCLGELASQLGIFLLVRLTLLNFFELGLPYFLEKFREEHESAVAESILGGGDMDMVLDMSSAEKQCKRQEYDIYEDFDEIFILYGYTTLFVAACPWVPLLALISTLTECFLDHKKLIYLYRRPFPTAAANTEPWDTAFDALGIIAMMTNTALVVFASRDLAHWSMEHKVMLFMLIEHWFIISRFVVTAMFPVVPWDTKLLHQQQQVLVHRFLHWDEDDPLRPALRSLVRHNSHKDNMHSTIGSADEFGGL